MNELQEKMISQILDESAKDIMKIIFNNEVELLTDTAKETLVRYLLKLEKENHESINKIAFLEETRSKTC